LCAVDGNNSLTVNTGRSEVFGGVVGGGVGTALQA